jgi:hypothetical protein
MKKILLFVLSIGFVGCNNFKKLTGEKGESIPSFTFQNPPTPSGKIIDKFYGRVPNPAIILFRKQLSADTNVIVYLRDGNGDWFQTTSYYLERSTSLGDYIRFKDLPIAHSLNGLEYFIYLVKYNP